jgi:formylglycine-generating enzyme required for sulfatase activity
MAAGLAWHAAVPLVEESRQADREPLASCKEIAAAVDGRMCLVPGGTVSLCAFNTDGPCTQEKVRAFAMDETEVTAAQFARCVEAGRCGAKTFRRNPYSEFCNLDMPGRGQHPMNCVNYMGARDYCAFVGKRLPSRAEWVRAAGAADHRTYPWGSQAPDCTLANFHSEAGRGCGTFQTWPVGSHPSGASPSGLQDMAGNVLEWTSTIQGSAETPPAPSQTAEQIQAEKAEADQRASRYLMGGSFADGIELLAPAFAAADESKSMTVATGFRCALDLPTEAK